MIPSAAHEELFLGDRRNIGSFQGGKYAEEQIPQDEADALSNQASTSLNHFIQIQNAEYTRSQGGKSSGDARPDDVSEISHTTSVDTTTSGLNASRKKYINKDGKPTADENIYFFFQAVVPKVPRASFSLRRLWEWFDKPYGVEVPILLKSSTSQPHHMAAEITPAFYVPHLSAIKLYVRKDSPSYALCLELSEIKRKREEDIRAAKLALEAQQRREEAASLSWAGRVSAQMATPGGSNHLEDTGPEGGGDLSNSGGRIRDRGQGSCPKYSYASAVSGPATQSSRGEQERSQLPTDQLAHKCTHGEGRDDQDKSSGKDGKQMKKGSDHGSSSDMQSEAVFEFYEDRSPGERPPLYDGMLELPAMKTESEREEFLLSQILMDVRNDDLDLDHSWFAVAWYPILCHSRTAHAIRGSFITYYHFKSHESFQVSLDKLYPSKKHCKDHRREHLEPSTLAACHTVEDQQPSSTRCDPAKEREDATGGVDKDTVRAILSSLVESVLDRVMEQEDTVPQMKQEPDAKQEQVSGSAEQEGDDSLGNCEYCTVKAEDVSFVDMFGFMHYRINNETWYLLRKRSSRPTLVVPMAFVAQAFKASRSCPVDKGYEKALRSGHKGKHWDFEYILKEIPQYEQMLQKRRRPKPAQEGGVGCRGAEREREREKPRAGGTERQKGREVEREGDGEADVEVEINA